VPITWDVDHAIVDLEGNAFDDLAPSAMWSYTLSDSLAPKCSG